jgi:hypothetical protein
VEDGRDAEASILLAEEDLEQDRDRGWQCKRLFFDPFLPTHHSIAPNLISGIYKTIFTRFLLDLYFISSGEFLSEGCKNGLGRSQKDQRKE